MGLLHRSHTASIQSICRHRRRESTLCDNDGGRWDDVEAHYSRTDVLLHATVLCKIVSAGAVSEAVSRYSKYIQEDLVGNSGGLRSGKWLTERP